MLYHSHTFSSRLIAKRFIVNLAIKHLKGLPVICQGSVMLPTTLRYYDIFKLNKENNICIKCFFDHEAVRSFNFEIFLEIHTSKLYL